MYTDGPQPPDKIMRWLIDASLGERDGKMCGLSTEEGRRTRGDACLPALLDERKV